jgi:hypothetical protein
VQVLLHGEPLAFRDFSHHQRLVLPSLRRPLSPRVVHAVKTILPKAVTDRLYPLYWRLTTPANVRAGVPGLKDIVWRIELPVDVVARRHAHLTFVIDEPRTPLAVGWSDDQRELGIHLRSLTLERTDRPVLDGHRVGRRFLRHDRASAAA